MSLDFLDLQALLKKYQIRPKKSLGQNFLADPNGLLKVIDAAEISAEDSVLEIGAGLGSLTILLAQKAKIVTAVELDNSLIAPLKEGLEGFDNVKLVEGDVLKLSPETLMDQPGYLVVANIPYYITSAIIRHLLSATSKPTRMIMTIQKEVAERILARDGKHSLLSLSVHVFGKPELVSIIPSGCFYPSPDVDSAVIRIRLYAEPLIRLDAMEDFFKLAHAGFSQKRKTLRNSLSAGLQISTQSGEALLENAGISPQRRAETLTIEEWRRLTEEFEHSRY
ncbi:MAG: 16S rRNA (adenine(1518)-N(6)/adenine(1519)-N(6))-dimethyltransferase RsmA [Anaerolineaceae bacterium]